MRRKTFFEEVRAFEEALVRSALAEAGGVKRKAARRLGISYSTFNRILDRLPRVADDWQRSFRQAA